MPNWRQILDEVQTTGSPFDVVRRTHLQHLFRFTGRNVIIYYSAWLQKGDLQRHGVGGFSISDADKNGFMTAIHKLDRKKGLDLFLHTPGGDAAATESLVEYLRSIFSSNIRAIVPQLAMSAGTMIACACNEIVMGAHSSLGPIDPQIGGMPAHGIIEEFTTARAEILADPRSAGVWQPIIAKYPPTLIGQCQKAIKWSEEMVTEWLKSGMFANSQCPTSAADKVVKALGTHALTLSHARHISLQKARDIGLAVTALESDNKLQDLVLTIHHACIHTLAQTPAIKIIENHNGVAFINNVQNITIPQRQP